MCFRPSAIKANGGQAREGECPSCGMPLAAPAGMVLDKCPHCGKPVPPDASGGQQDKPAKTGKIL